MGSQRMKTQIQIQRAHDMLLAMILREVPIHLTEEHKKTISLTASVLCWVLEHDHNPMFGQLLAELEHIATDADYGLEFGGN